MFGMGVEISHQVITEESLTVEKVDEDKERVDPTDRLIGRGHCSIGDAVPEPLGFIAFAPE
jgi:hypothetical protein